MAMKHNDWFTKTTNDDAVNAAATKAEIAQRTLARQLDRGTVDAENVIKIAIAYGSHPVGALVETGYLDEKYAHSIDPTMAARLLSEEELADEVLIRMKLGVKTNALTTPIDAVAQDRNLWLVADESPDEGEGTPDDYEL